MDIDELMRQKLNGEDPSERFAFREAYWEQAEALLAADEQARRRRRMLIWWWLLAGLLLAGGGAWWLFGKRIAGNTDHKEPKVSGIQPANGQDNGLGKVDENNQATEENSDNEPVSATEQSAMQPVKEEGRKEANRNKMERLHAPAPSSTTGRQPIQTADNPFFKQNKKHTNGKSVSNKPLVQPENQRLESPLPNGRNVGSQPTATPPQAALPGSTENTADSSAAQANASTRWAELVGLPTPLGPLVQSQPTVNPLPRRIASAPVIVPERLRRWSLEIMAAGTAYRPDPGAWGMGGVGGLDLTYRLKESLWLRTGAHWRYEALAYAPDDSMSQSPVVQLRYSFGYVSDTWKNEYRGLHWLELPLSVGWQREHWSMEAGVAAEMLLAAQGQIIHEHQESLAPDVVANVEEQGWVDKSPYRPFKLAVFGGLGWQATPRLGLSLRAAYRPGTVTKLTGSDAAPTPNQTWWFDLGARYRLF